ncbi:MAG: acyltransferase [Gemmatales bacterium]
MRGKNQLIEGLRLLCSFMVVGSHITSSLNAGNFPAAIAVNDAVRPVLFYVFYGSSVYFFQITGFILAAKLPEWRTASEGLLHQTARRITRLLFVFWAALLLVTLCNLFKQWLFPPAWVPFRPNAWLAEFFLASSATGQEIRMIPPAWYLEIDLLLILGASALYLLWCELSPTWQKRLRPFIALIAIAVTLVSLLFEKIFLVEAHPSYAFPRAIGYFILGVLAWHARTRLLPLGCLIVISVSFFAFDDHSVSRKYYCSTGSILLAWILSCFHHHPGVKYLLDKYPIERFSKISLGLFLTHYLVLTIWISLARHLTPRSVPAFCGLMLLSLPVMYLVAWLFHTFVEKNVLALHRWLWSLKPQVISAGKTTADIVPASNAVV